ncbi:MAG: hypothetical protein E6R03_13845 [Hyphomicrobiaceae bacterium]|nr:MAG: hypothetical protein E6R03_13845 [Hyphomicrobiaceae bacterium]
MTKYKLRLTRSFVKNGQGLELLRLALWKDGTETDHVTVVSGGPGRQNFRLGKDSQPGTREPIPEGRYKLTGTYWVNGEGRYTGSWGPGLGPVVIDIVNGAGNTTKRAELRIHQDENEDEAPGTSGCIGTQGEDSPADYRRLKKVIGWVDEFKITDLEVDYFLGTFPKVETDKHPEAPKVSAEPDLHRVKLYAKPGKCVAYRDGVSQDALSARLDFHSGKLGLAINGSQLPMDQIQTVSIEVAYKAGK